MSPRIPPPPAASSSAPLPNQPTQACSRFLYETGGTGPTTAPPNPIVEQFALVCARACWITSIEVIVPLTVGVATWVLGFDVATVQAAGVRANPRYSYGPIAALSGGGVVRDYPDLWWSENNRAPFHGRSFDVGCVLALSTDPISLQGALQARFTVVGQK